MGGNRLCYELPSSLNCFWNAAPYRILFSFKDLVLDLDSVFVMMLLLLLLAVLCSCLLFIESVKYVHISESNQR